MIYLTGVRCCLFTRELMDWRVFLSLSCFTAHHRMTEMWVREYLTRPTPGEIPRETTQLPRWLLRISSVIIGDHCPETDEVASCLNPDPDYSASYNSYLLLTISIYYTCGGGNSQGIYVNITIGRLLVIITHRRKYETGWYIRNCLILWCFRSWIRKAQPICVYYNYCK